MTPCRHRSARLASRSPLVALASIVATFAAALVVQAQDPGAAQRVARLRAIMDPVAPLAGRWEGEARVVTGPGSALVVRQHEDVALGGSGTVLFVRGAGRSTDPAARDSVVFEAAGVLWADAQTGKLRMRAYRDGNEIEADLVVRPDTVEWGFLVPGGRIRYVIAFGNDTWHEVGHFLREGAPPYQVIEMRLQRKR